MESKPSYPQSLRFSLTNKFDKQKLESLLTSSQCRPLFVYGSLMLASVMSAVIGLGDEAKMAKRMLPARLEKHRRYAVKWADFPAIVPTTDAGDVVEGMLVLELEPDDRNRLHTFESGLYTLEKVDTIVVLCDGKSCTVETEVYVWGGENSELDEMGAKTWSIDGFLNSDFYASLTT